MTWLFAFPLALISRSRTTQLWKQLWISTFLQEGRSGVRAGTPITRAPHCDAMWLVIASRHDAAKRRL
jgi:hypothetical protein